jgi:hypothetical protein
VSGLTPLLLDDGLQLLELSLGSEESSERHLCQQRTSRYDDSTLADPLLGELPGLLVLGVPQQLHDSLLVRGETGNLSDDVPDEDLLLAAYSTKAVDPLAQALGMLDYM